MGMQPYHIDHFTYQLYATTDFKPNRCGPREDTPYNFIVTKFQFSGIAVNIDRTLPVENHDFNDTTGLRWQWHFSPIAPTDGENSSIMQIRCCYKTFPPHIQFLMICII